MELLKRLIYIYRLPSLPAAPHFTYFSNNSYLSSEISLFAILDVCLKSDFGSSLTLTSFFTRSVFRLEISARYSDALYSELFLGSRLIEIFGIGGYSGDIFSSFTHPLQGGNIAPLFRLAVCVKGMEVEWGRSQNY